VLGRPDAAATAIAACWRGKRGRVGERRRHRAATCVSAVARGRFARDDARKRRIRRDRITRETEVSRERHKRLGALQAELERLKKTPAELASTYEAVHARRREARLKRWREEEEEALKPPAGSKKYNDDDDVEDFSSHATPTSADAGGDAYSLEFDANGDPRGAASPRNGVI
jgi:flagellar motility protein MotE (MotC chaperone)